jgi:hypothetical protein
MSDERMIRSSAQHSHYFNKTSMFTPAMAEERSAASNYIVDLGSNIIEKVDGSPSVFNLNGKALFNFKIGRGDNQLLLESEVRDLQGKLLAKVAANSFVFYDKLDYEEYGDIRVEGIRKKSNGEVLIEIKIQDSRKIKIKGKFEHPAGYVLINDDAIIQMPNNNRMSGNHIQNHRAAFEITGDDLAIS